MTSTGLAARSIDQTDRMAEQLAARARDGADGREIVRTVERVPAALTHNLETLNKRLTELEKRPVELPTRNDNADCERQQNDRIAAIEGRIEKLETAPVPLVPATDGLAEIKDRVEFVVKRLAALDARMTEYAGRLDEVEARPHVSQDMIQQLDDGLNAKIQHMVTKHVNGALGDVRSRLVTVERASTTGQSGDSDSAKISKLASMLQSFGEMLREIETTVDQRQTDLEQLCAELSEHVTDSNVKVMQVSTRLYRALAALQSDDEERVA